MAVYLYEDTHHMTFCCAVNIWLALSQRYTKGKNITLCHTVDMTSIWWHCYGDTRWLQLKHLWKVWLDLKQDTNNTIFSKWCNILHVFINQILNRYTSMYLSIYICTHTLMKGETCFYVCPYTVLTCNNAQPHASIHCFVKIMHTNM